MKRSEFLDPIKRLVEIVDGQKATLPTRDVRELNRVKNWIRDIEERPVSSVKVIPAHRHNGKGRGIAI
jgi:hypothetical protein